MDSMVDVSNRIRQRVTLETAKMQEYSVGAMAAFAGISVSDERAVEGTIC